MALFIEDLEPNCAPTRFGLLSVSEIEDRPDGHWQYDEGYTWEQESCDDLTTRLFKCVHDADPAKPTDGSGLEFPDGNAFVAIAPFKCATAGLDLASAWDHAQNRLNIGESRTVERAFWTGKDALGNVIKQTLGGNAADVTDITPGTGAVSITDGVAMLESWAGENMPCSPVIHVQRGVATYMTERNLTEPQGNIMYAKGTGTRVAVGGGYLATGPGGVVPPDGEGWMFVTSGVKILRGPTFFTPDRGDIGAAVDRSKNDITVFAERAYGFVLGCGIAAVRTTLKSCCC